MTYSEGEGYMEDMFSQQRRFLTEVFQQNGFNITDDSYPQNGYLPRPMYPEIVLTEKPAFQGNKSAFPGQSPVDSKDFQNDPNVFGNSSRMYENFNGMYAEGTGVATHYNRPNSSRGNSYRPMPFENSSFSSRPDNFSSRPDNFNSRPHNPYDPARQFDNSGPYNYNPKFDGSGHFNPKAFENANLYGINFEGNPSAMMEKHDSYDRHDSYEKSDSYDDCEDDKNGVFPGHCVDVVLD